MLLELYFSTFTKSQKLKNYQVKPYSEEDRIHWNQFVTMAKNGNFLFHRDFMEYHKDRFLDCSLVIREKDSDNWYAVFPANFVGEQVFSHSGLTFGGLVYNKIKLMDVIEIFRLILKYYHDMGYRTLDVKMMPNIYNTYPSEEFAYALFLSQAQLVRRDVLAVLDLSKRYTISERRKRGIKKGVQNHLRVQEKMSFDSFWNEILIPNLKNKYDKNPVHTVAEMEELKSHFPMNIRQFNVYHFDELVGGTTVFVSDNVVHVQYISAKNGLSDVGNLDFLVHHLMVNIFPNKKYFEFGCSNEENGRKLNTGLSYWKESFGSGNVVQDFYTVETANYSYFEDYAI